MQNFLPPPKAKRLQPVLPLLSPQGKNERLCYCREIAASLAFKAAPRKWKQASIPLGLHLNQHNRPHPVHREDLVTYGQILTTFYYICCQIEWRIMLCDAKTMGETDIRIRFNKLCEQFSNNKNYIELDEDGQKIPDSENIRYEISVHDKRYEAIFYQVPNTTDTLALQNDMKAHALTKYTEEQLANPTPEIQEDIVKMAFDFTMQKMTMKPVWFMISEHYGKYYITMFYDNEYNRANGEDL